MVGNNIIKLLIYILTVSLLLVDEDLSDILIITSTTDTIQIIELKISKRVVNNKK